MKNNLLIFDVEATSLHGTAFAVGAIVTDKQGNETEKFELLSKQGKEKASDWVKENVIPNLINMPTCDTDRQLRELFYAFYCKHKDTAEVWSDCNFPVETNFLTEIVNDDLANREFSMPYPLNDVSTVVDVKIDRIKEYGGSLELKPHSPIDDARASAFHLLKKLNENNYDSTADTLWHIKRVNELLGNAAIELIKRGQIHDTSKLNTPEKELFDKYTPLLKTMVYGTDEYKQSLANLKPALDHHYAKNSHHPEHKNSGIDGMNLFDVLEMMLDWKAATERGKDGNIFKSIEMNKERFKMTEQLCKIFENTADFLGYQRSAPSSPESK